jgi:hypothetical protein
MADAETPATGGTLEKALVEEQRRGSVLFGDEAKRKASVATLTANIGGE